MQRTGRIATAEASRYLQRLCFHFSKKIAVDYDSSRGLARFPWGDCRLHADGDALTFVCEAESPEGVDHVCHVIDEHVRLFSRRTPMAVEWETDTHR